MQSVSSAYKTEIKNTVRNPSYIKINFKVTDPQAIGDSVVSDNGSLYYSRLDDILEGTEFADNYITLEHNRGILSGVYSLPPREGEALAYQGFIGNLISDNDGHWTTNPTITVNFQTTYFQFVGLSFIFDTELYDYPKNFCIKAYNDDVLVQTITAFPDNFEYVIETPIVECNKLEFIGIQSNIPHRRFRIKEVVLGLNKTFFDKDVSKASWERSTDLINAKLPSTKFSFTLLDKDKRYDPDNPNGIYKYMEALQETKLNVGYEVSDGNIEWQPIGTLFTDGNVKVTTESAIPTVDFNATSLIEQMNTVYDEGVYNSTGVTLYSLAEQVLTYAELPTDTGINRWILDDALKNYTTKLPLPVKTCKELLQLIANAGMCMIGFNRNGYITISPKNDTIRDFAFTFGDILNIPTTKKYPILQGVDTCYNVASIEATTVELSKIDISGASATTYNITYEMATNISATIGSGLTIIGTPKYYARMCEIVLTGNGTLTITGKKINVSKISVSKEYNSTGERCPIENELINNPTHATAYVEWVGDYTNRRTEYEFDDRGFPEIDCGDSITLDTLYTELLEVDIISSKISYNGALSGKTKVLVKE